MKTNGTPFTCFGDFVSFLSFVSAVSFLWFNLVLFLSFVDCLVYERYTKGPCELLIMFKSVYFGVQTHESISVKGHTLQFCLIVLQGYHMGRKSCTEYEIALIGLPLEERLLLIE